MSVRLHLALSQVLMCGVLLPGTCLTVGPAAAQTQLAPDRSIMTYRLQGAWRIREVEYIFEPMTGGIMGKAPGPNLLYREIDRATGEERYRGTLTPDVRAGVMSGSVRWATHEKPMRAWVDDRGRLWMDNYNATSDGQTYARVAASPGREAMAAWKGRWNTSRGTLEISEEGSHFVGWILNDDGSRRERVAFQADARQANGAWDSEYDAQGTWQRRLVGYGDLSFTLSADGKNFNGWYSTPTASMGLERRDWTGQRADRADEPPGLDATAEQLRGRWFTPFGPIEMAEETVGNRVRMSGRLTGPNGQSHQFVYLPGGPTLLQNFSGVNNYAVPFALAPDGLSFEVDGSGRGINGVWRATRSDPDQTRSQPTPDQSALLRVLEGRWRQRDGQAMWRFPVAGRDGAVNAVAWNSAQAETSGTATTFAPAENGSALVGRAANGPRLVIERNTQGEVILTRPAQGGEALWSTELIQVTDRPTEPSTPAPSSPTTPPASPSPGTSSQPNSQPPTSPAPSAFQPLNRVDVRLDRVVVARGYPTHQVHAFVTVKNTSAVPQYFTSGFLKVVLADADGVSWERSQPYRASGEPAELFGSTPVIQPGGELRVRFVFLPEADARLTSLTLSEGGKQAQFPVSGL